MSTCGTQQQGESHESTKLETLVDETGPRHCVSVCLHCTLQSPLQRACLQNTAHCARCAFYRADAPANINLLKARAAGSLKNIRWKEVNVADTAKIKDKAERKKLKRAARKKAAPKAKRTTPRGSLKKKVKKMVRGQSKR
jgi:hypothetical protein